MEKMKISNYKCPNCNTVFDNFFSYKYSIITLELDKKYNFNLYNIYCDNCKNYVRILQNDIVIAWLEKYEYLYDKYVINKNKNITSDKTYFYFYYPTNDLDIIKKMFDKIKKNYISSLIIPEKYHNIIDYNGEICLLPNEMFYYNNKTIFPNYLAEQIIINEANKYNNSKLYSCYNTFFYNFNLLYKIKSWKNFIKSIN